VADDSRPKPDKNTLIFKFKTNMDKHKTIPTLSQTTVMRSIRVYSNALDERLDYNKEYVFHHWIDKRTALIEVVENGFLMEIVYDGNFNFNVD
jgi:hypothetical protein